MPSSPSVAAVLAALVVACAPRGGSSASDSTAAKAAGAAESAKLTAVGGMNTPECVRYDPELDVFFVSNINGGETAVDGVASIDEIRADSLHNVTTIVKGGVNGVTLNAPKGIAIVGDTLWVADIDVVRGFNRRSGDTVATIDLRAHDATFLNDVAVGPDGAIYVTDTGLQVDSAGNETHSGMDRIFKIVGRTVSEVARGAAFGAPNGLTWDSMRGHWILAPYGSTSVQTWREGDRKPATLASGPGEYDGVEVLEDGRILVSSWADSAVHVIRDGTMTVLIPGVSGPADIGVDTRRHVLAVPRFNDNKVEFFRIPP